MYNVRVVGYGAESELRLYEKPVKSGADKDVNKAEFEEEGSNENDALVEIVKVKTPEEIEKAQQRSVQSSLNRTINKIYNITRPNEWEYFVTLTFDEKVVDRYNYEECSKAVQLFLDITYRYNPDMKYIIVPELHKDGAYHFHGLFSDIPNTKKIATNRYSYGKYVFEKENVPLGLEDNVRMIYAMERYKYGYSDIQYVEDSKKASMYIVKYITKELSISIKGKKRYWHSDNCKKPTDQKILLTSKQIKKLLEDNFDAIEHQKITEINASGYSNSIAYLQLKNADLSALIEEKAKMMNDVEPVLTKEEKEQLDHESELRAQARLSHWSDESINSRSGLTAADIPRESERPTWKTWKQIKKRIRECEA